MKSAKLTDKQRRRPRLALDEQATLDRQNLRNDLGQRLRQAREEKKIGLRELARRLGVSASLISQIETGKTEPSINTLFAMVSELELSVNVVDEGVLSGWRWVYFNDPDGYPLELVEVAYYNAEERRAGIAAYLTSQS